MAITKKHYTCSVIISLILLLLYVSYSYIRTSDKTNSSSISKNEKKSILQDNYDVNVSKSDFQEYMETTAAELTRLQQELKLTNDVLANLQQETDNSNITESIETPDTNLPDNDYETEIRKTLSIIDDTILTEEIDNNWSSYAETELINNYGTTENSNIEIINLECRSTLCKMNVSISSSESMTDTYQQLQNSTAWDGATLMEITPDGSRALIYLSREGYNLPNNIDQQNSNAENS